MAQAQIPTRAAAERLLRENPELARQRLLESGMSQAEIRAQLTAAGIPADALDAFLSGEDINATTAFDANAISALELLGVAAQTADGLELIDVETGMQFGDDEDRASIDGFPIFGHDVFTRASSQFQPLLSGPVPDDYRIGPGDRMVLILTGEVELAHDLAVTREGFVVVPEVGRISIANLTMAEARILVRSRLEGSYSGIRRRTTTVDLTIVELRTNQVYVIGEVTQPGAYQLSSVATVTNALYAADGPTVLGNLRGVRVQRRNGEEIPLDLYPYLLRGDVSGDVTLEQGDVVFVPLQDRRIQVHGSVMRPAYYELSAADDLIDVVAAAGGFAPAANRKRVTIHRVVRPGERGPGLGDRIAIDLALTPSTDPEDPNSLGGVVIPPVGLQAGDSIVVDAVADLKDGYYVTIVGQVAQPDTFPWREGMTVRNLMDLARGPTVGADLREAEISRLPDHRELGELADRLRVPLDSSYLSQRDPAGRYVGPPGVQFPAAGSSPEFTLAPYDQVLILRQPDFAMPGSVKITGEVSVPGEYTLLSKNDRVTDLVGRAGTILEHGYLEGARLYRTMDNMGRIDLNLPAALEAPESAENINLQPGDSLDIPVYSPTVIVQGAVNSPVTVLYREGQNYDYYLAAAGGYRNDADKGRTSVRYANGLARTRSKFLFWSSYPDPGPGSVIAVPAKDPADRVDTRGLIADIVTIAGSITTMIVVIVPLPR
jgi:protein involved in polysaccharide export with SLBB domain